MQLKEQEVYQPTDRRPIAARKWSIWQPIVAWIAKAGVSANSISVAGMVAGILAGLALVLTSFQPDFARREWLAAALLIQLRLLANLLDRMVAIESGQASVVGELYNEDPDSLRSMKEVSTYRTRNCKMKSYFIVVFLMLIANSNAILSAGMGAIDAPQANRLNDWKHSGSIWLLTTPEGADLPADAKVEQFPVLVRLHRDFFDFAQAMPNGDDLRFSLSTGEQLAFQIEEWDAAGGVASIWVRVPIITGNSRQEIKLHWGNPNAAPESDGTAVFNESNGYLSVWHMHDSVDDTTGTLVSNDTGTTATQGVIGGARHFSENHGVFCGDKIPNYPTGSDSHSTEVWFRPERPNSTLIGWGNEQGQGKVVMQYRSPPHIRMDCYFSGGNVAGASRVPVGDWTHVVHTYRKGEARLYVNGVLDGTNVADGGPLQIQTPARLFLGGWYNNYDFVGDLDEVRVSQVVRSPEWVKLQFENQKPNQSLVGPIVQPGKEFLIS